MRNREKITQVSVFFLILGLSICLTAYVILPRDPPVDEKPSFNDRGFVFKTSENLNSSESTINIAFSDIDCENGKANCSVSINPYISNTSEHDSAFFLLQVPFIISNLHVNYLAAEPTVFGGNNLTETGDNMTCIYIWIPKEKIKSVDRFDSRKNFVEYDFTIESGFIQINQYTYEFPITWSGSLNDAFEDRGYSEDKVYFYSKLHFFKANRAFLYFERISKYYYSKLLPNCDRIGVWWGNTSYQWDLKPISGTGGESSIIIELTNLSTKSKIDLRYSILLLQLGIGVPTVLTSTIEIIRNEEFLKKAEFWKKSGNHLLTAHLISFFLFLMLIHIIS